MEYLAPRAFAAARPHLSFLMGDDPAAKVAQIQGGIDQPLAEHVIGKAMKAPGAKPHSAGFETLAWEAAAIEALRTFHNGRETYHRMANDEGSACSAPKASVLHGIADPIYVEIDGIGHMNLAYVGASFANVKAANAQGDEKRDHLQITLWPRDADRYGSKAPIGRFITVAHADGDDLIDAIHLGVDIAKAAASKVPLAGFRSDATTLMDDDVEDAVHFFCAAAATVATSAPVEPQWQDGIKPYLLAKTEGPKGDAGARALLRRGYVREHRHGLPA